MLYNIFVAGFAEWLREKFQEWNSKQDGEKTYADFARYLGVPPTSLSNWINSGYRPRGDNLALLAAKYPEVYEILGFPRPQEIPLDQLPSDLRSALEAAINEITAVLLARGIDPDSPEGVSVTAEILERHGFVIKEIKKEG